MSVESFDALVGAVVASSAAGTWNAAVLEWDVINLEEDPGGEGICVCGQTGLVKLFTIRNRHNGAELYPIGSVCVNQFGVENLNRQVSVFTQLLSLRTAIRSHEAVTLSSEYFSRAVLEYLYFNDAFTPDQWNGGNGENDYEFLAKMFNKRNKEDITAPQNRKISALLNQKVLPFIASDERLR